MSVIPALEATFLQYWFRAQATVPRISTAGGTSYLNVCSASPGESGTSANELQANRLAVTSWATPFYDAGNARPVLQTAAEYAFPTGTSGVATHLLLSDVTATTHRFLDSLAGSVTYGASDVVRFRSGQLEVALSGLFSIEGGSASPAYRALENLVKGTSSADVEALYWGLSSTAPSADGSNVTEPSVGAYARILQNTTTTFTTSSPSGSSPTTLASTSAIVWPEATASWGTMTHWVAYDSLTSGSLLYYGTLDNPTEVVDGLQPQFAVGDLVVSCD